MFRRVGALLAQVPLRIASEHFGWRGVVVASASAILLVGVLAWAIVKDDPLSKGMRSFAPASIHERKGDQPLDPLRDSRAFSRTGIRG
jgi:sugar phosphate permease